MESIEGCITFETGIISIMSSYAVGNVVRCSNTKRCDADISISCRFDIENTISNVDSDGNNIMVTLETKTDTVSESELSDHINSDHQSAAVHVYGERREIMCSECVKHSENEGIKSITPMMMLLGTRRQVNHNDNDAFSRFESRYSPMDERHNDF